MKEFERFLALFGSEVLGGVGFDCDCVLESLLLFVLESKEELAQVALEEFGGELKLLRCFGDEGFALLGLVEVDLVEMKVAFVRGLEIDFEDFEGVVLFESANAVAARAELKVMSGFGGF